MHNDISDLASSLAGPNFAKARSTSSLTYEELLKQPIRNKELYIISFSQLTFLFLLTPRVQNISYTLNTL